MTPLVLGLDFGSSFTKVAVRPDWNKASTLFERRDVAVDDELLTAEARICSPNVVACQTSPNGWFFGSEAARIPPSPTTTIYHNWKSRLFQPSTRHTTPPEPATVREAAEASARAGTLVLEKPAKVAAGAEPTGVGYPELDLRELTHRYFSWLRRQVQKACQANKIDFASARTRVCVPDFASTPASPESLSDDQTHFIAILEEAGWKLTDRYPLLSEPLANVIGILTGGRNSTWHPPKLGERRVKLGGMILPGSVLTAMRKSNVFARLLVVDIGAFTTDFAILGFNSEEFSIYPDIATHSEAIGVKDLDQNILEALPRAHADALRTLEVQRREAIRHNLYAGKSYRLPTRKLTYGEAELEVVRNCIERFAENVVGCAGAFLDRHSQPQIDELVLTGGGNNVAGIRERLTRQFEKRIQTLHVPSPKGDITFGFHPLSQQLVRGGSALGAASVYFDVPS